MVRIRMGRPFISRNCLGIFEPIRFPLPPATMIAYLEVEGIKWNKFR